MRIPVRNIDAFQPPKESFCMRSDMSKAAPSISYARAKGVAVSCILFENHFIRKPMTVVKEGSHRDAEIDACHSAPDRFATRTLQ